MSNHLIGQLIHEQKFSKEYAARVAMLTNLIEAGRPLAAAAKAACIAPDQAASLLVRLKVPFESSGPA